MIARENLRLSKEIEDIIVADLALAVAFTLMLSGGVAGIQPNPGLLLYFFPISIVAVSFSFVLHELMHKLVAQHFGAVAAFRRSDNGIVFTLITSMFGFLVGIPGATVIYAQRFTRNEEGYVSLAGPLTNFAVFVVFFVISLFSANSGKFVQDMLGITMLVSLILAFFNMLPIYPLDGSKVLRWNMAVYFAVVAVIFVLLIVITQWAILYGLVVMLIIAFVISSFYRRVFF